MTLEEQNFALAAQVVGLREALERMPKIASDTRHLKRADRRFHWEPTHQDCYKLSECCYDEVTHRVGEVCREALAADPGPLVAELLAARELAEAAESHAEKGAVMVSCGVDMGDFDEAMIPYNARLTLELRAYRAAKVPR